jgi:hypothetical protein
MQVATHLRLLAAHRVPASAACERQDLLGLALRATSNGFRMVVDPGRQSGRAAALDAHSLRHR